MGLKTHKYWHYHTFVLSGDNSPNAVGTFYEGVMARGYSSAEVDAAVQANIVAAGYGK